MIDSERSTPTSEPTWNVPTPLTPLIGRDQDVARACGLLKLPEVRELTLVGTGDIGKTRLGLQIAMAIREHFADGVYFVPLVPISDSSLIIPTIAHTATQTEDWPLCKAKIAVKTRLSRSHN
jgi:hypothetical protein